MQASEQIVGAAGGRRVVVLGTGGTIAGSAADPGDNLGYTAAQLGVAQLVAGLPAADGIALHSEQVAQIDSKDMDHAVWALLAQRCAHWLERNDVVGIVVTHGTDTLEETAYFLQATLAPAKPIVLTCAMRPATALVPDGPQNLLDAIAVACTAGAQGVIAVCAGEVHSAFDVQKVHPYRLDAFDSGDAGPLGYVEEGALRRLKDWPAAGRALVPALRWQSSDAATWPRVEIVMNHAGAGGRGVDALVRDGVHGLVAAGTGNGSLHHALEAALLRAEASGVHVLRTTRCAYGRVLPHAGDVLQHADGLSPVKARVRLMLELLA